tara:strand:- start:20031 stop:20285 length:255 start_codon:yes stop_codon:yes gene_type:complete
MKKIAADRNYRILKAAEANEEKLKESALHFAMAAGWMTMGDGDLYVGPPDYQSPIKSDELSAMFLGEAMSHYALHGDYYRWSGN